MIELDKTEMGLLRVGCKMLRPEELPEPPAGYRWDTDGQIWRHLCDEDAHAHLWAVRDEHGRICAGVIRRDGYIIEPSDMDTFITVLLTKVRLGCGC